MPFADRFSGQANSALTQPSGHLPLLVPVECFGDKAKFGILDYIAAMGGSGEEEDLFLDVDGEVVCPNDLARFTEKESDPMDMKEIDRSTIVCCTGKRNYLGKGYPKRVTFLVVRFSRSGSRANPEYTMLLW